MDCFLFFFSPLFFPSPTPPLGMTSLFFATQELHSENPWSSTGFVVSILGNSLVIAKKGKTLEQELQCLETMERNDHVHFRG